MIKSLLFQFTLIAATASGFAAQESSNKTSETAEQQKASAQSEAPEQLPGDLDEERKKWTRIQIFLDDAEFNPGKIDGRWGEFTSKALTLYMQSQGHEGEEYGEEPPENLELPMDKNKPVFTTYTVTDKDMERIGDMAEEPKQLAEQSRLPYTSVHELVAEKFHVDKEYLRELNPDVESMEAGDKVTVPAIGNPFDLKAVEELKENGKAESEKSVQLTISTQKEMLEVRKDGKLVACYPVTPGAKNNPAPKGDWKVTSVTWLPTFRWDKSMLQEGERSDDAHVMPGGPNSPVGIIWIALNSKGIGIHGTKAPDTIGRTSSHGCIRLSNWDAYELGQRGDRGTEVQIK